MLLSQIVSIINKQNPSWTAQSILDLIDGFQQMVLQSDSSDNIYFDTSTGELPSLATQTGVFNYTLSTDYYRIKAILTKDSLVISNNPAFSRSDILEDRQPMTIAGKLYYEVETVKTQSFNDSTCSVMFRSDPGNATYYIYGLVPVNTISSISSTLKIPDEFHLSVVIPCIQLLIDGIENGRYAENIVTINDVFLPKIIHQKLRNSTSNNFSSPVEW